MLRSKLTKFLFQPRTLNKLEKSKFYYYFAKFNDTLFRLLFLLIRFSNYSKQYLLTQIFLLLNYYYDITQILIPIYLWFVIFTIK